MVGSLYGTKKQTSPIWKINATPDLRFSLLSILNRYVISIGDQFLIPYKIQAFHILIFETGRLSLFGRMTQFYTALYLFAKLSEIKENIAIT